MFIPAKPHAITKNKFSWALFFIDLIDAKPFISPHKCL